MTRDDFCLRLNALLFQPERGLHRVGLAAVTALLVAATPAPLPRTLILYLAGILMLARRAS